MHEITSVDGDLGDLLHETFTSIYRSGYIKVDGCILPQSYKELVDAIENLEVREDDIWLCGFPKTGTTWTQEMVWTIANGLDDERSKVELPERFPMLDAVYASMSIFSNIIAALYDVREVVRRNPTETAKVLEGKLDGIRSIENMPSLRFIKTHIPWNLLPRQLRTGEKRPKFVYVARNAKDTCVSFYHHCKFAENYSGTFEQFYELFLGDTIYYGPFWKNVIGYWNKRNDYNMLFLKYEDMKKDLPSVIKKTATFLGKSLTEDEVAALNDHLSFASMKENPAVNNELGISSLHKLANIEREGTFMRSGTSGQWKTVMPPELVKGFDDWSHGHLNGTGLSF